MIRIKFAASCTVLMAAALIVPLGPAYSQAEPTKPLAQCVPNKAPLFNMCVLINRRMPDTDPNSRQYQYRYQRRIHEASCVDPKIDSKEVIVAKIDKMWNQFEDDLICNETSFSVMNGSILKFAVASGFERFIRDAAEVWKINLNKVDKSDDMTVLDYTQSQLDRYKDSSLAPTLKDYYETLRNAGAKHRAELEKK